MNFENHRALLLVAELNDLASGDFDFITNQRPLLEAKRFYVPRVLYSANFCKNAEYRPPDQRTVVI